MKEKQPFVKIDKYQIYYWVTLYRCSTVCSTLTVFSSYITFLSRIKMHEEKKTKQKKADNDSQFGNPSYLLERENQIRAKVLSNTIKQKRKEKAVSTTMITIIRLALNMIYLCMIFLFNRNSLTENILKPNPSLSLLMMLYAVQWWDSLEQDNQNLFNSRCFFTQTRGQ